MVTGERGKAMITSSSNPQLKYVQQLAKKARTRKEDGVFLVEGPRMFYEAPKAQIKKSYLSERFYNSMEDRSVLEGTDWELVEDSVFDKMSATMTPQGVLCVLRQPSYRMEDLLKKEKPLLVFLENLQDPGNMGTIFRTAEGAGADGIIMTADCVDIYNPKTIRSTMGSIYRMPFVCLKEGEMLKTLTYMRERGIATCAAHLKGEHTYDKEDYTTGCAFMIGNEGNGLTDEAAQAASLKVRIPMEGKLESLNASVAASILLYEAYRQRRQ